jgi:hypothetical protein
VRWVRFHGDEMSINDVIQRAATRATQRAKACLDIDH